MSGILILWLAASPMPVGYMRVQMSYCLQGLQNAGMEPMLTTDIICLVKPDEY